MKKILLVAGIACVAMTSCKKDYTCSCTLSSTDPNYTTVTSSASTGKMKKSDADSKCTAGNKTYELPGSTVATYSNTYTYTEACSIK